MEERLEARSHSLDALQKQPRNFLHTMNAADREKFRPLGTLQLQTSCYNRFATFRELVALVLEFNQRLEGWLRGQQQLDNLLYQYNLFVNLSTRLMSLRLKKDEESVLAQLEATKKWFSIARQGDTERKLGNLSGILQVIKNYKQGPTVDAGDNVHMYRQMSRTQHGQFQPPRERLRDFKRKQLITPSTEVDNLMATRNTFFSDKATSTGIRTTNRNSLNNAVEGESADKATAHLETMPASNEKATIEPTGQQEQPKEQQEVEFGGEEGIDEEFEEEEEQPVQTMKKPYTSDAIHNKPQQRTLVRTAEPQLLSGERRILLTQEKEYYQRIEDSKAIEEVKKWSKMKSREATQLARRVEAAQQGNHFKACEFELTRLKKLNNTPQSSEKQLKRRLLVDDSNDDQKSPLVKNSPKSKQPSTARPNTYIQELRLTAPVKLSASTKLIVTTRPFQATGEDNPLVFLDRARQIEQDIRETRLTRTINTYSKYIRHTSESTSRRHMPNEQQLSTLRQATLTSLPRSRCTKIFNLGNSFGEILYRNRPQTYNDDAQTMIERIKAAMSSKGVTVPARTLNSSLRVPAEPKYSNLDKMYRAGERLISNPWFPKNLGKKKKKKK